LVARYAPNSTTSLLPPDFFSASDFKTCLFLNIVEAPEVVNRIKFNARRSLFAGNQWHMVQIILPLQWRRFRRCVSALYLQPY
jgi:hypothetical protein